MLRQQRKRERCQSGQQCYKSIRAASNHSVNSYFRFSAYKRFGTFSGQKLVSCLFLCFFSAEIHSHSRPFFSFSLLSCSIFSPLTQVAVSILSRTLLMLTAVSRPSLTSRPHNCNNCATVDAELRVDPDAGSAASIV